MSHTTLTQGKNMLSKAKVYPNRPSLPDYVQVITLLLPEEASMVFIKAQGFFKCLERSSTVQLLADVKDGRTGSLLISLSRKMSSQDIDNIKYISINFPSVRLIGYIYDSNNIGDVVLNNMLKLGECGMKEVIKADVIEDWFRFRSLLSRKSGEHIRVIMSEMVLKDLKGAPPDCLKFFSVLFERNYYVSDVEHLCCYLGVKPGTLNTRFRRSGLPSPKDYLIFSRLVRMASLLEPQGARANTAALRLGYSSEQMFLRHLGEQMGMGSTKFRELYNGKKMLDYFRKKFIIPYIDVLKEFKPLNPDE